jgi:hypothetical protein
MLGHERVVHADVRSKDVPWNVFLAQSLLLAMFGVLLPVYLHEVRGYGLEVAREGRVNAVVPWIEVHDLINDGLLVCAQQSA